MRLSCLPLPVGLLLLASCAQPASLSPDDSISAPPVQVGFFATVAGTDLGTLGGRASYAQAINKWGTLVGYSNTATGEVHASAGPPPKEWSISGPCPEMLPAEP